MQLATVDKQVSEVRSTLPWYRRALSRQASYTNETQKDWKQKIGSQTFGKLAGGAVIGLSVLDFILGMLFNKEETSFSRKYLVPLFGVFIGSLGIGVSKPPENVFEVDLVNSGALDITQKVRERKASAKSFYEPLTNEELIRLSDVISTIMSNAERIVKGTLQNVLREAHEGLELKDNVPFLDLCFATASTDKGRQAFSRLCGIGGDSQNPNNEQLDTLKNLLNKKLKNSGIEFNYGYDKNNDSFNLYFRTEKVYANITSPRGSYVPCIVLSTKPYLFYAALNQLQEKIRTILACEQINDNNKSNDELNHKLFCALEDFLCVIGHFGYARAGYFDVIDGKLQPKPKLRENINQFDVAGNITELLQELSLRKDAFLVDEAQIAGVDPSWEIAQGKDTSSQSGLVAVADNGEGDALLFDDLEGLVTDDTQVAGKADAQGFNDLVRAVKEDAFSYFGFELKPEEDTKEVTRLKICLIKARAWQFLEDLAQKYPHFLDGIKIPDEVAPIVDKDPELNKKIEILKRAVYDELEKKIANYSEMAKSGGVEVKTNKEIPKDLLKLEYFRNVADSMPAGSIASGSTNLYKLISVINNKQAVQVRRKIVHGD